MKIGDLLFFAPGIRFDELDLTGAKLPEQLQQRIGGYYVEPSRECCKNGHAFAAGVLLVSCIDATARLRYGGGVGERFRRFAAEELASFSAPGLDARFYDEYRNGLVHEARLKRGAQFSLERPSTVEDVGGILLINPQRLADEVEVALKKWIGELTADTKKQAALVACVKTDFADDLAIASS